MNQNVKINILLVVCVFLLGGCAELRQYISKPVDLLEPNVTNYLLSCLNDIQDIGPEEFVDNFKMAEKGLQRGRTRDKLRFICVSLHAKADYKQFKQGTRAFEQYFVEHPNTKNNIHQGFKILLDRLDEEMMNNRSVLKSMDEDKKEFSAEVKSLQGRLVESQRRLVESQKQIEQLKNIENIIESRETEQP